VESVGGHFELCFKEFRHTQFRATNYMSEEGWQSTPNTFNSHDD